MKKAEQDKHSRDGKKTTTKGGKGGKVNADGSSHKLMGSLTSDDGSFPKGYDPTKDPNYEPHESPRIGIDDKFNNKEFFKLPHPGRIRTHCPSWRNVLLPHRDK